MNFNNNQENQESLGASHVLGGCNSKAGDLSTLNWAAPQNKQDCSDSTAVNPRRSAPTLRAVGLTALIHPALLNPEFLGLAALAAAICLLFLVVALVQKCKQVGHSVAETDLQEVRHMLAGLADSFNSNQFRGEFNHLKGELDHIRESLERLVSPESYKEAVATRFIELRYLNEQAEKESSPKIKSEIFGNLRTALLKVADDYKDSLSKALYRELQSLSDKVGSYQKLFQGIQLIRDADQEEDFGNYLKVMSMAFDLITEAIDNNLKNFSSYFIERGLKLPAKKVLSILRNSKGVNRSSQNEIEYNMRLRQAAGLILWNIKEFESERNNRQLNFSDISNSGNEEDQIRKNQNLRDWLQARRDQHMSEDEIQEAKEESELLKSIIDSGRPEDKKLFS